MQPISLKLENFGPYEDSLIDFSNFYAQSLFLITGKTGAGKTTIFDGMCYALYGSTSGGLRQGKEMRSNFAEIGKKTKVVFTFKQDKQTYEIVREPEQLVKKQRGEGFREQASIVNLTVFDENKKEINQLTKQKDVGPFLSELIQLNDQQFAQIVMLPQGEFRRFLNADSDNKEKVLRKLFNTYFYQNIAETLRQHKKKQETSLKEVKQELVLLTSQLEWQSAFDEKKTKDMYYQDILVLYKEQEIIYANEVQELADELVTLRENLKKNQELIQSETKIVDLFKEKNELADKLIALKGNSEEIKESQTYADLLSKAAKIETTFSGLRELKEQYKITLNNEQKVIQDKEKNERELAANRKVLSNLIAEEELIQKFEQKLKEIEASIPLFEKKNELEIKQEKLEQTLLRLVAEQEQLKKRTINLESEISKSQKIIEMKVSIIEEKYQLIKDEEDSLKKIEETKLHLKECQKIFVLKEQQMRLKKQKETLENEWQEKLRIQKQLKSDVAKAQIAKLSLDLIEGEACVVCGSLDHPNPSHGIEISKEEMNELESSLELAEESQLACKEQIIVLENELIFKKNELVSLEKEVKEAREIIQTYVEVATKESEWLTVLNQKHQLLTERVKEKVASLLQIEETEQALEGLKKETLEITDKASSQEQIIRNNENEALQLKVSYEELVTRLPKEWENALEMKEEAVKIKERVKVWHMTVESLNEKIANQNNQLLIETTTIENIAMQKSEREEKIQLEEKKVAAFLEASSLDETTLTELILNLDKLPVIEQKVKKYEQELHTFETNLEKIIHSLEGKEEPDLTQVVATQEKWVEQEKLQQEVLTTLQYRIKQNEKILNTITAKEMTMKVDLDALEELTELTNVMTGDGGNKLSMERFVLQTYLKRILERANEKLILLTHGRYQFELKEEQGSFKKKTGLEINIFDDNVGSLRGVNTLSGGESFIAALSLALSLAEVIQEEAGGIKIDAMFIDEGFGSLDEDALEMAIRSLESIEGDGRLIGIISHVRELKERIPQQLQIKSTLDGKSYVEERLEFE
ncbi:MULTISPECIES: SMC family ATPase [Vagococcus]|uniref:Nuclease SbcCD subunit C n=1 Tax=Vagococcus fluvialis bH819 TaxID=1255619 RepID=A0A1X6WME6_9ENTE|nr:MULTISPECIES: SMC family ATPase [Vagococcus]SLM85504.1 Exonuclease SbcC [Vagococcus fluvialis bH819]HCM89471.1 SMC family ATPase [Vagococcus sp.]